MNRKGRVMSALMATAITMIVIFVTAILEPTDKKGLIIACEMVFGLALITFFLNADKEFLEGIGDMVNDAKSKPLTRPPAAPVSQTAVTTMEANILQPIPFRLKECVIYGCNVAVMIFAEIISTAPQNFNIINGTQAGRIKVVVKGMKSDSLLHIVLLIPKRTTDIALNINMIKQWLWREVKFQENAIGATGFLKALDVKDAVTDYAVGIMMSLY